MPAVFSSPCRSGPYIIRCDRTAQGLAHHYVLCKVGLIQVASGSNTLIDSRHAVLLESEPQLIPVTIAPGMVGRNANLVTPAIAKR